MSGDLYIDAGKMTVTGGAVVAPAPNMYSRFAVNSTTHTISGWINIPVGGTTLVASLGTCLSDTVTISVQYSDAWE
jgi:hypothetical protein